VVNPKIVNPEGPEKLNLGAVVVQILGAVPLSQLAFTTFQVHPLPTCSSHPKY